MRRTILFIITVCLLTSCATMKLQVPARFAEQATQLHVKKKSRALSFGNYQTSHLKGGWEQSIIPGDDNIQQLFTLHQPNTSGKAGRKFHFTFGDGKLSTIVLFKETKVEGKEQQLNGPAKVAFSRPKNHEYSLAGIIREQETTDTSIWQFYIHTWYDFMHDSVSGIFELPYTDAERFISNGTDTITIRPVRVQTVQGKKREGDMPVKLLSGFEFRMEDGVVAIVDIRHADLWLYNELDDKTKLIIASAASVMLFRKEYVE